MTKQLLGVSVVAIVALILGTVGAVADENVWVTKDDEEIVLGTGGHFVFSADDATTFDVSELADGESRTFGEGDKQVTVTRNGDEVTINHSRGGGDSDHVIVCALSSDVCKILQIDGDPGKTMVMIKKSHQCQGSEVDCAHVVMSHVDVAHGEPGRIVIRKTIRCNEDGDCEESEDTANFSATHAEAMATVELFVDEANLDEMNNVIVVGGDGDGKRVLRLSPGEHVTLRCPEGDATLLVKREEADETFLCPKHSVPLEKVTERKGAHKILIREKVDEDSDD